MEILNQYSGLFSLLAVLAAVIVPIVVYKLQRRNDEKAALERDEKEKIAQKELERIERQDAEDELKAMGVNSSPFSLCGYSKMEIARAKYLWKKAGRR